VRVSLQVSLPIIGRSGRITTPKNTEDQKLKERKTSKRNPTL